MTHQLERDLGRLVEHAREAISCEIKAWLDLSDREQQANLAKAIMALANTGGGYVASTMGTKDGAASHRST